MEPNWRSVAGKADDSHHRAKGSRATAADVLKRGNLRREREMVLTRRLDELLAESMVFDRIRRICEQMAPEVVAERIGELRDHPDYDTEIQSQDVFREQWNVAWNRALDQLSIRQVVESSALAKAQTTDIRKGMPAPDVPLSQIVDFGTSGHKHRTDEQKSQQ
jgi:hypothetical protein